MKVKLIKPSHRFVSLTAVAVLGLMLGCAHEPKKSVPAVNPISIAPSANPAEELSHQHALMDEAYADQVDVLAPIHFNESKRLLTIADDQNAKGAASTDIIKTLGLARAHLQKADKDAVGVQANIQEVTIARDQAIKAGARGYPVMLNPLDQLLQGYALASEKVTPAQELALKNQYLNLELSTIKEVNLGAVKKLLEQAKVKNAEKITPKYYQQAVQNYNIAETMIETDRHSAVKINTVVKTATLSAERVMKLLASEQSSRNQTPEQRAVILESRDQALLKADTALSTMASDSIQKGDQLAQANSENSTLKKREHDDQMVKDAAALFTNSEADVYRQEGLLIIRLKSMNFASGRSDLPAESIAILTKVKNVISDMGPGSVMVEGHTDAVGAARINQKLSENRAKAVMEFFANDKLAENNKLDSAGYGFSKPLASNKTKEGRAQNRRVDIIIKPSQSI